MLASTQPSSTASATRLVVRTPLDASFLPRCTDGDVRPRLELIWYEGGCTPTVVCVVTQAPYGQRTVDQGRACLLITGAPGAGKSTVSGLVAGALSRSALIDAYFVSRLVASGYVWPLGEPADEAARQVRLLNTNLCSLARTSLMPASPR